MGTPPAATAVLRPSTHNIHTHMHSLQQRLRHSPPPPPNNRHSPHTHGRFAGKCGVMAAVTSPVLAADRLGPVYIQQAAGPPGTPPASTAKFESNYTLFEIASNTKVLTARCSVYARSFRSRLALCIWCLFLKLVRTTYMYDVTPSEGHRHPAVDCN
jgi:hypothetical protein